MVTVVTRFSARPWGLCQPIGAMRCSANHGFIITPWSWPQRPQRERERQRVTCASPRRLAARGRPRGA
eukprot:2209304-Karenia_brevis.AAC.1